MNFASQPLQIHEITAMKKDPEVMGRVLQSYCMMLEFYGMKLDSPETGLLSRVMPESRYADRYRNLVSEYKRSSILDWGEFSPESFDRRILSQLSAHL